MKGVLITVDCLRSDHVTPDTMPNLFSIKNEFDSIESCFATGTQTSESGEMIMTSSYPSHTGGNWSVGDDEYRLQELLPDTVETAMFHSNVLMGEDYGFSEGFDTYVDFGVRDSMDEEIKKENRIKSTLRRLASTVGIRPETLVWEVGEKVANAIEPYERPTYSYQDASEILSRFWEWENGVDGDYFAWIHLLDPHTPYKVRTEYLSEKYPEDILSSVANQTFQITEDGDPGRSFTEKEKKCIRELYRSEIRYVDDTVSSLIRSLSSDKDGFVLLSSDHGEHLFEHDGGFLHHAGLWDELIEVPWVASYPDAYEEAGTSNRTILDISPTILNLFDETSPEEYEGRSAFDRSTDEKVKIGEYIIGEGSEPYFLYGDNNEMRIGYYPDTDQWVKLDSSGNKIVEISAPENEISERIREHLQEAGTGTSDERRRSDEVEQRLSNLGYK